MKFPFFSEKIQIYRTQKKETLVEAAASLGVNHSYLSKLEGGNEKPSTGFLNKLISHFPISKVDAIKISYELGYKGENLVVIEDNREEVNSMPEPTGPDIPMQTSTQVNLSADKTPILYTDSIFITSNQYGIVLNIAQNLGPINQQQIVTRIGMSREHAKVFLDVLGKHLALTHTDKSKKQ